MNKPILTLIGCLAFITMNVTAQAQTTTAPTAPEQGGGVRDEVRSISGHLKEAHSSVWHHMTVLRKEIGPDVTQATPEQAAQLEKLNASLQQLESMLTVVNTADGAAWPEVKEKALAVRAAAVQLANERKAATE